MNQSWNLLEPFAKQNEATNKNGVVGSIGNITPIAPIPRLKNASISHSNLNGFLFIYAFLFRTYYTSFAF